MIIGVIAVNMVKPTIMDIIEMRPMLYHHMLFAIMAVHVIFTFDGEGKFFSFGIG